MFSVYLFFQKNTQYTTHLTSLDSPILQKMNPIFQRHTNTIHLKHGDHFNDLFPPVNFRRQTSPRTRFVAECFIPQKCFFHFSRACFVESANKLLQIFFPKGFNLQKFPKFQLSNTLRLVFCQIFLNFRISSIYFEFPRASKCLALVKL